MTTQQPDLYASAADAGANSHPISTQPKFLNVQD